MQRRDHLTDDARRQKFQDSATGGSVSSQIAKIQKSSDRSEMYSHHRGWAHGESPAHLLRQGKGDFLGRLFRLNKMEGTRSESTALSSSCNHSRQRRRGKKRIDGPERRNASVLKTQGIALALRCREIIRGGLREAIRRDQLTRFTRQDWVEFTKA
jgi:hypothetical protein